MKSKPSIEERLTRLERLEKLRYNLHGLLNFGWDEQIVTKDPGLKNISDFKQAKDIIENQISNIQYDL